MLELVWDKTFLKALKKWKQKHPDLEDRFTKKLTLFTEEPFHPLM